MLMGACLTPLNQVVIVTEYLSRGNLKDCLNDIKSLPLRLKIGSDIANGLGWLHAHNIIHRDLKLANLLVTTERIFILSLTLSHTHTHTHTQTHTCTKHTHSLILFPPPILLSSSSLRFIFRLCYCCEFCECCYC
jgi:serine/threonine protein kinase